MVNLKEFNYDKAETIILNWIESIILLTYNNITLLTSYTEKWLSREGRLLAFNHEAIANDLLTLKNTAILRYFPADNGRNETILIVGNGEFIEREIAQNIER